MHNNVRNSLLTFDLNKNCAQFVVILLQLTDHNFSAYQQSPAHLI